ncbi:uncharacterized protein LOC117189874 isoform X1 [Drosophila miranda]|uniref:uncharacterized protein LOC117189874 isoform X1 n=1 Tax=Drosophila miranda TaxID=7229 RepID=UPI00143FA7C6|nr:uncharacterized protein LOC117189874 isoform X1 [Drosophila miranda]
MGISRGRATTSTSSCCTIPTTISTTASGVATTHSNTTRDSIRSSTSSSSSRARIHSILIRTRILTCDILWLPKSAMRPAGPDASHTDCILVVGVSRPKLAVVFLTVMLISLFLTFHVLYDSAVYNFQAAQAVHERHRLSLAASASASALSGSSAASGSSSSSSFSSFSSSSNHLPAFVKPVPNANQLSHPMVFPSSRVHFPKTSRRLPQVPERVRAMNASIKLLLIVREPVTRAISDYTQLRSHAATAILPLAERESSGSGASAAAAQPPKMPSQSLLYAKLQAAHGYDNALVGGSGAGAKETKAKLSVAGRRPAGAGVGAGGTTTTTTPSPMASAAQLAAKSFEELAIFPNGTVIEAYRPLSISMYHVHLHRWLEVFPREQLLVVNGDRLIEDPVSQLRRIEVFLGIEHRVKSEHFYFNETKGFYCLRYDNGDR